MVIKCGNERECHALIFAERVRHVLRGHLRLGRRGRSGDGFGVVKSGQVSLNELSQISSVDQVALCVLKHQVIHERERDHGFHHRHRARDHARVVSTASLELRLHPIAVHRILRLRDRRRRFERNLHLDHLPVGDATLDTAGAVRARTQTLFAIHEKLVVVLATLLQRAVETATDFETFRRR